MIAWSYAPAILGALAAALAIAALWPPVHVRRMASAVVLALIAAGAFWLQGGASIPTPVTDIAVFECEVARVSQFQQEALHTIDQPALAFISERVVLVLPDSAGQSCSGLPPGAAAARPVNFESCGAVPSPQMALCVAGQVFDSLYPPASWRTRRVWLFGSPGGPLAAQGSPDDLARLGYMFKQLHAIRLEYRVIGDKPTGFARLTAPAWRATEYESTPWMLFEVQDRNLRSAEKLLVGRQSLQLDGVKCDQLKLTRVDPEEITILNTGDRDPDSPDFARLDRESGHVTIGFRAGLDPDIRCGGWSSIQLTLEAKSGSGDTLITRREFLYLRRNSVAGVVIVLPNQAAPQERFVRPTWSGDVSSNSILAEYRRLVGSAPEFEPHVTLKRSFDCIFTTTTDGDFVPQDSSVSPIKQFPECLSEKGRLVLISPTEQVFNRLANSDIGGRIEEGALHVLVVLPPPLPQERRPAWLPALTSGLEVRTDASLFIDADLRQSLRREVGGTPSKLELQRKAVGSLTEPSTPQHRRFMGPANVGATCRVGETAPLSEAPFPPAQMAGGPVWVESSQGRVKGKIVIVNGHMPIEYNINDADHPADRFGTVSLFKTDALSSNPLLRLATDIRAMEHGADAISNWSRTRLRATRIFLFAYDGPQISIDGLVSTGASSEFSASDIIRTVNNFLDAGGAISVIPIRPPPWENVAHTAAALKAVAGDRPIADNVAVLFKPWEGRTNIEFIQSLSSQADVAAVVTGIEKRIHDDLNADNLLMKRVGQGFRFDRRNACVYDISDRVPFPTYRCAFDPAHSLDVRRNSYRVPERYAPLSLVNPDPFRSGDVSTVDGLLAASVNVGKGSVHVLGYSPLARDMFSGDMDLPGNVGLFAEGRCFHYEEGSGVHVVASGLIRNDATPGQVPARSDGWGLRELLDFSISTRDLRPLPSEPLVDSIMSVPGSQALDLVAWSGNGTAIKWHPIVLSAADTEGACASAWGEAGPPADVIFRAFDPATGRAIFRLVPRRAFDGVLRLRLAEQTGACESRLDTLLPVTFTAPSSADVALATSLARISGSLGGTSDPGLARVTASVIAMFIGVLALFSPPLRRWSSLGEFIRRSSRKQNPNVLAPRRAPLFSLEAAFTEWGAHPGEAHAGRQAGLPAGRRSWRAGDAGGAIVQATLFPLVIEDGTLPVKRPVVRLKTATQAAGATIVIDGSGGLRTPLGRVAPSKLDFAARFGAFVAGAALLSHGKVAIFLSGDPIPVADDVTDPSMIESTILSAIEKSASEQGPLHSIETRAVGGQLVIFICDGLSLDIPELEKFAEVTASNSARLRIAAVVSPDDVDAATLARDPVTGAFADRTELGPGTLLAWRNERIAQAAAAVERHAAMLKAFSADADEQTLLQSLTDTGLLA